MDSKLFDEAIKWS